MLIIKQWSRRITVSSIVGKEVIQSIIKNDSLGANMGEYS